MKKVLVSAVAVGCLAAAGAVYAGIPAGTGVNGSLHDMTKVVGANADSMGRVCVFCHTPHHADSNSNITGTYATGNGAVANGTAPLWNRANTSRTYTEYQWVTPANKGTDSNGVAFQILDPLAGPSRLCMSCHDGVTAIDQHGQAMAQPGTTTIAARANLTGDLTQTHPIGFDYVAIRTWRNSIAATGSGSDSEIVDPEKGFATDITITEDAAANQGTYNTITRNGAAGNKRIKDVLYEGSIMTCASCHEVHNKENATQDNYLANNLGLDTAKAPNYFLYAKQTNSLICLSCHVK